jgi:hypothetical protein
MFSGHAGTGKTWCATEINRLAKVNGLKSYEAHFANGVKEAARYIGWNGQKNEAGRIFLQDIGRAGRKYNGSIWARNEFDSINSQVGFPFEVVTIDDWRFNNELSFVLEHEWLYKPITVRIIATDREILAGTEAYNDVSETELDTGNFDFLVENWKDTKLSAEYQLAEIFKVALKKYSSH